MKRYLYSYQIRKKKITDIGIKKNPTNGGYLIQQWHIKCNDKNKKGKITIFVKSSKTNTPRGSAGAAQIPTIGYSNLYSETSGEKLGSNVFDSFERTDIMQISNITLPIEDCQIQKNSQIYWENSISNIVT